MESKKPPAYSWIIFILCETGNQLQYRMSNYILKHCSLYRFNSKSRMATLKHMQYIFTIFLVQCMNNNNNNKKKTIYSTGLSTAHQWITVSIRKTPSEMYSRLCPVKSSLHFYYIYSIRIWNENTLAVYTEKLKLETYCTVQWFFNPWEMRHLKNVCKRTKEINKIK